MLYYAPCQLSSSQAYPGFLHLSFTHGNAGNTLYGDMLSLELRESLEVSAFNIVPSQAVYCTVYFITENMCLSEAGIKHQCALNA